MTPRPIHRWKTLWLGLFILISIAWAWATSIGSLSGAHLNTRTAGWIALYQFDGEAGLFYDYPGPGSWSIHAGGRTAAAIPFDPGDWHRLADGSGIILLPHWLIILAFLLPWSALLLWRWRKAKHLTDPSREPSLTP